MKNKIKNIIEDIYYYYTYIIKSKNNFKIPLNLSLRSKLSGFTPDQYVLYRLDKNNPNLFISEFERWKTRKVNGRYSLLLDDKFLFREVFGRYIAIPDNLFLVKNKKIIDVNDPSNHIDENKLYRILKKHPTIFMKPLIGGGGKGVYKISCYDENCFYINDVEVNVKTMLQTILHSDDYIATVGIDNVGISRDIYPNTTNTIRLVTLYDKDLGKAKIPFALHRFGHKGTGVVDNASSGGIFAMIDVETGVLTQAKDYYNNSYNRHPNTNVQIEGEKISNWDNIAFICRQTARKFPYIPYMAWDIVPQNNGFYVLEINASTGLTFVQMFTSLKNTEFWEDINQIMK